VSKSGTMFVVGGGSIMSVKYLKEYYDKMG